MITNISSILLPYNYPNINHSDLFEYLNHFEKSKSLFKKKIFFNIESPPLDPSLTFDYFAIILNFFIKDKIIISNLFFLLTLTLTGLSSFFLINFLINNKLISFFCGTLYMTSNYIFHQYYWGHLNLIQLQYLPLIFLFIVKLIKNNYFDFKSSAILGILLSLQSFSSAQYSVYLLVIIIFCFFPFLVYYYYKNKIIYRKNLLLNFLIVILLFILLSGYYINKRLVFHKEITRSLEENLRYGWHVNNIFDFINPSKKVYIGPLSIFYLIICLFYFIFKKSKQKKYFFPFILMFFISLISMFGPISKNSFYYFLYKYFPLIDKFRVPLRFFPFLLLSIVVIYAYFLKNILKEQKILTKFLFLLMFWLSLILQYAFSKYFMERYLFKFF